MASLLPTRPPPASAHRKVTEQGRSDLDVFESLSKKSAPGPGSAPAQKTLLGMNSPGAAPKGPPPPPQSQAAVPPPAPPLTPPPLSRAPSASSFPPPSAS